MVMMSPRLIVTILPHIILAAHPGSTIFNVPAPDTQGRPMPRATTAA